MQWLHSLGLHPPDLRRLRHRLDRVGVEPAAAVARAAHHEDRCLVGCPVERTEQGLVPGARRHVAREGHGVGPLPLVVTVDHVEEEVGARPVEHAPPDLVHDQAGRPRRRADHPGGVAAPGRPREAVPGLGRLEIVRLGPPEAALVAVRLGQVGLPVMESFP